MAKTLTPAELYERINNLFIDIFHIQEIYIKELIQLGVSEQKARIIVNTHTRQVIDKYLEKLTEWRG